MRIATLETSTAAALVALAVDERIVASAELPAGRRHARDLAPTLAALCERSGWAPASLELILVSQGPGSFTGLRVGLMLAKTIAFARKIPLVGVDTLAALAATPSGRRVLPLVDAQQQTLYGAFFEQESAAASPRRLEETRVLPAAEWIAELRPGDVVAGPAAERLAGLTPEGVVLGGTETRRPPIETVHRLGLAAYRAGRRDDPLALEPVYLRPSSAEQKWDARLQAKAAAAEAKGSECKS